LNGNLKISETVLKRLSESSLGPAHFINGFLALLAATNQTRLPGLAITIDYAEPGETVGPDELIPIITLSFRDKNVNQEASQETSQEADQEDATQVNAQDAAQVGPDVSEHTDEA
jgi:hypothetical protein